MIWPAPAKTGL